MRNKMKGEIKSNDKWNQMRNKIKWQMKSSEKKNKMRNKNEIKREIA